MTITAWRIVKRKLWRFAFDGEGAQRFGGRWNSKGVAVIYAAQSQSLAALEILVHLDSAGLLQHYMVIPVKFDSRLVTWTNVASLPASWQAYPPPRKVRALGDNWVAVGKSAILQVPSVIVPSESNFLLNPAHPDFAKLKIGPPVPFKFDRRLLP